MLRKYKISTRKIGVICHCLNRLAAPPGKDPGLPPRLCDVVLPHQVVGADQVKRGLEIHRAIRSKSCRADLSVAQQHTDHARAGVEFPRHFRHCGKLKVGRDNLVLRMRFIPCDYSSCSVTPTPFFGLF